MRTKDSNFYCCLAVLREFSNEMERRKGKKKGKQEDLGIPAYLAGDKPSKELKEIATYMKNNVPTKTTRFLSHSVDYFICESRPSHGFIRKVGLLT